MTKSIKIHVTELGQKYFTIYEVRVSDYNDVMTTYDRCLTKKAAEQSVKFVYDVHQKLYRTAWIKEVIVWC